MPYCLPLYIHKSFSDFLNIPGHLSRLPTCPKPTQHISNGAHSRNINERTQHLLLHNRKSFTWQTATMPLPSEPDIHDMSAVLSEDRILSSSTSPGHRELSYHPTPSDRPLHCSSTCDKNGNNDNNSDDANPQAPNHPSTVSTSRPHSQVSHLPGGRESSASHDAGAQPLDHTSTFQKRFSGLESVWQSAEASVSRLSAALEKREDGEMMGREGRRDDGSPDRFFMIDEATRVESDDGARAEARSQRQEENAPLMRREGTKEGDRERRVEELREGVLEEEGRL